MTITIDLPLETEEKVKIQASHDGIEVQDYIKLLIKEASDRRERIQQGAEKSFAEILAPVHRDFEKSGMGEADLTEFLDELREEVWQEKQRAK